MGVYETLITWEKLDSIARKLDQLLGMENTEMADLTRITEEVAQNTEVVASASALIAQLAAEIRAAGTDAAALDALANELDANSQALADAVAANTPAVPAPPV